MADPIEVKTLKDILQELKDTNIQYSRVKEQSEKLNEKFTPNVLRGMQNVELRNQIIGAQQDLARSVQALADKMKAGEAAATIAEGAGNIAPVGENKIGDQFGEPEDHQNIRPIWLVGYRKSQHR